MSRVTVLFTMISLTSVLDKVIGLKVCLEVTGFQKPVSSADSVHPRVSGYVLAWKI